MIKPTISSITTKNIPMLHKALGSPVFLVNPATLLLNEEILPKPDQTNIILSKIKDSCFKETMSPIKIMRENNELYI